MWCHQPSWRAGRTFQPISGDSQIRKTPALTMVDDATGLTSGVGATMAPSSQL